MDSSLQYFITLKLYIYFLYNDKNNIWFKYIFNGKTFYNIKRSHSSTLSYHNELMNVLISFDMNLMTSKQIESYE